MQERHLRKKNKNHSFKKGHPLEICPKRRGVWDGRALYVFLHRNLPVGRSPRTLFTLFRGATEAEECKDYITSGPNSCYFSRTNLCLYLTYEIWVEAGNQMSEKLIVNTDDIGVWGVRVCVSGCVGLVGSLFNCIYCGEKNQSKYSCVCPDSEPTVVNGEILNDINRLGSSP